MLWPSDFLYFYYVKLADAFVQSDLQLSEAEHN